MAYLLFFRPSDERAEILLRGPVTTLLRRCKFAPLLALATVLGGALPARAQDYPTRPVRIITDSAPGSAVDVILRVVADRLTRVWGQQVLPVNQPGAGGAIAARAAASATPDGYTLAIPALSAFVALPGAAANLPIQVPRDFIAGRLLRRRARCSSRPRLRSASNDAARADRARQAAAGRARLRHQRAAAASPISPANCCRAAPASSC